MLQSFLWIHLFLNHSSTVYSFVHSIWKDLIDKTVDYVWKASTDLQK